MQRPNGSDICLYATLILDFFRRISMTFAPCATVGFQNIPLFGHLKCLSHVRCITRRKRLWDPAECRECLPLLKLHRRDPTAPTPLFGMWISITTYLKYTSKKAPRIADEGLQKALTPTPKPLPTKRKHPSSSKPTLPLHRPQGQTPLGRDHPR